MSDALESAKVHVVQEPGPNELRDPVVRAELKKASVWFGLGIAVALFVLLVQPILIIFGGLVFASMLDGGARLLGRILPIPRTLRIVIVILLVIAFFGGIFYLTGMQIAAQAEQLRTTLEVQANKVAQWVAELGLMPGRSDLTGLAKEALGSVGKLTSAVGSVFGAVSSFLMIVIIGLFVALEPRIYERGLQWLVPSDARDAFAVTISRMATTMRRLLAGRLLGMLFEGVLTAILLWFAGVPMALLLGIITGVLAFIPNIGAFISGVMMVSVGFSAGTETGIWAIIIYFGVQNFDGYVVLPLVARRTVDMPPALTLSSQILASTLFGVLGLALADPIVAMIKVALESEAERAARAANEHGSRVKWRVRLRKGYDQDAPTPLEPPTSAA
ncbi:putative PurR-regulated permease PerM [Sphingomonas kyeonggiensis]|uniref:Putative PurR-regulated permease PerM n=1 Tax=Sphingomonas kyeonggiensis TaxID=1268553 RepID=A0A7W7JZN6_9SPHN|nr:AI-2E family transporter [Sphingomonas kyeonggiensis]MBB4838239.1 putative PurR-regulated permease PerM [Sphingomonas kyeonggiensis]